MASTPLELALLEPTDDVANTLEHRLGEPLGAHHGAPSLDAGGDGGAGDVPEHIAEVAEQRRREAAPEDLDLALLHIEDEKFIGPAHQHEERHHEGNDEQRQDEQVGGIHGADLSAAGPGRGRLASPVPLMRR